MVNTMNILIQGADRRHIGVRTGYLQMIVICIVLSYCTGFKHSLRAVTQWKSVREVPDEELTVMELNKRILAGMRAQEERLNELEKYIVEGQSYTSDHMDAKDAVIEAKNVMIATKDTVIEAMSSVIKIKEHVLKKRTTKLFYLLGRLSVRGVIREMEEEVDLFHLKPDATRAELWRSLLTNNVNRLTTHLIGRSYMSSSELDEWIQLAEDTYSKASEVVNKYYDTNTALVIDTKIFSSREVRLVEGICESLEVNFLVV